MMKRCLMLVAGLALLMSAALAVAQPEQGLKKLRPLFPDYGKVVIKNYSGKKNMPPVVFDHWLHRTKFTCGLCHVDLRFGMKAGTTDIRAADNMNGLYCGACHNGKMRVDSRVVFNACAADATGDAGKTCYRCHSVGKAVSMEHNFAQITAKFPKERFGNGINWVQTEELGLIKPISRIEGVSRTGVMPVPKDFNIEPKLEGLPQIIFSHTKHAAWNGCEVCHAEIFPKVTKGITTYSMDEIFSGKYCGVCHGTVAFPNFDCQRCHVDPAQ